LSYEHPTAASISSGACHPIDKKQKEKHLDNIFEALRESHETQRKLCRRLVRIKPDDARAQQVFRALRIELAAHAAAEERFLYAPILLDDMGLKSSRHALAEHHEIDECVEEMAKARGQHGVWPELAKKLSHQVHHHLREEERKFFQISGKILSDGQKKQLATKYRKDLDRMRTVVAP
jgi:methylphosphotriester-DNA--protein-cysteine methyltransferase